MDNTSFRNCLGICCILIIVLLFIHPAPAAQSVIQSTTMCINNMTLHVFANGQIGVDTLSGDLAIIYPHGTAGAIFQDGFLWGGFVRDGHEPALRLGGQTYHSATVPGKIIQKGIPEVFSPEDRQIWRIRRDWQTADLTREAMARFNIPASAVTDDHIKVIRAEYQHDWESWPWEKGAPFYDINGNNIMDEDEEPGLEDADQVIWLVANDIDSAATHSLYGAPPIGMEMQMTLWAYHREGGDFERSLDNTVFKQIKLLYKGLADTPDNAIIDSMVVAQFTDPDLGDYSDDFLGCDTTLQLGYVYNSTTPDKKYLEYAISPPAVGYTLLQGPRSEAGFYLPMTFFWYKFSGSTISDPNYAVYDGTLQMYNLMNGYTPRRGFRFLDNNYQPTFFPVSGDPVTGTGDLDGVIVGAGDRRFLIASGSFQMALGDTQTVTIAIIGGSGSDHLASVSVLKHFTRFIRQAFAPDIYTDVTTVDAPSAPQFYLQKNYPNPFNAGTTISYITHRNMHVRLSVYNIRGQLIRTLVDRWQPASAYHVRWDGTNDAGIMQSSGLYIARLQVGHHVQTQKMLIVQ